MNHHTIFVAKGIQKLGVSKPTPRGISNEGPLREIPRLSLGPERKKWPEQQQWLNDYNNTAAVDSNTTVTTTNNKNRSKQQ